MVEMLAVLAISSVIVGLGIGLIDEQLPRFREVQVSKGLRQDLMSLRNTAIERGVETRLVLVQGDTKAADYSSANAGEWKLQVGDRAMDSRNWSDLNEGGRAQVSLAKGGNNYSRGVSLDEWEPLTGPWSGNQDSIVFSPRGWVSNPDKDFGLDGYITLSVVNKAALKHGVDDHIDLKIARSGNVTAVSALGSRDAGTVGISATSEGS